jgi:hypothetical protein
LQAIDRHAPRTRVATVAGGHVKTLMASAHYQQAMLGIATPRKYWWIRIGASPLEGAQL